MTAIGRTQYNYPLTQEKFDKWIKESKAGDHTNINNFISKFFTNCSHSSSRFFKLHPEMCLKCIKQERKIAQNTRSIYFTCMELEVFDHLRSEKISIFDKSGVVEVNFNSTLFRMFSDKFGEIFEGKKKISTERCRYEIQLPMALSYNALLALKEIVYHHTIRNIDALSLTDILEIINLFNEIKDPICVPDLNKYLWGLFDRKIDLVCEVADLLFICDHVKFWDRFSYALERFFKHNGIRFLYLENVFYLPPNQIGLLDGKNSALNTILKKYIKGILIDTEADVAEMALLEYLPDGVRHGLEKLFYGFSVGPMLNLRSYLPNLKTVDYPFSYFTDKSCKMPVTDLFNLAQPFGNCDLYFYDRESNPTALTFTYTTGVTELNSSARVYFPHHVHKVSFSPGPGLRICMPISFKISIEGFRKVHSSLGILHNSPPPGITNNSPQRPEELILVRKLWG